MGFARSGIMGRIRARSSSRSRSTSTWRWNSTSRRRARSDALADTLDYAALHATIVRLVRERSYDLLERLGADLLEALLADPRVQRASVRIAKPELLGGATPAVTVRQARG